MSVVPPDIVGSALQAGFAQREASRTPDAARTGQVQATERQLRTVDEAASNVETTDDDTKVFADAEGAGGQGRAFHEASAEETEDGKGEGKAPEESSGRRHLDIQA